MSYGLERRFEELQETNRQHLAEIERLRAEVAKLEPYRAAQQAYDEDYAYRERLEAKKLGAVLPEPEEGD